MVAKNNLLTRSAGGLLSIGMIALALVILFGCTAPPLGGQGPNSSAPQGSGAFGGIDQNRSAPAILVFKFRQDYSGDFFGTINETSGIYTASFSQRPINSTTDTNGFGAVIKLTNNYFASFSGTATQGANFAVFDKSISNIAKPPAQGQTQFPQMQSQTSEVSRDELYKYVIDDHPFTEAYSCKISFGGNPNPTRPGPADSNRSRTLDQNSFRPTDRNFTNRPGVGQPRDLNMFYSISDGLASGTIPSGCQKIA